MARLIIFDDHVRGVDLRQTPVILGRSRKSDIPIRDDLLSRKHCAILPTPTGHRLVDLKSSHGTYLNGRKIERVDLKFDDVIEIGETVMVFLRSSAWQGGESLPRLRHPAKARQLVNKLSRSRRDPSSKIPVRPVRRRKQAARRRRDLVENLPALQEAPLSEGGELVVDDHLVELLVDYSVQKTVSHLVRHHPRLRRLLVETVEEALVEMVSGNWDGLRERLRDRVREKLGSTTADDAPGDGKTEPSSSAPEDDTAPPADGAETDEPSPSKRDTDDRGDGAPMAEGA